MVMKSPLVLLALVLVPFARVGAGASAQLYPLTVLSDNPSAYWRLDELNGNVAHDHVGGHDCLLTNKVGIEIDAEKHPAQSRRVLALGSFGPQNFCA